MKIHTFNFCFLLLYRTINAEYFKICEIYTDSEFWINVITRWAPGWKAKGWKKSSKGEIQNLDLVKKALEIYENSQAKLIWVKAHVGHDENEIADDWANKARLGATL